MTFFSRKSRSATHRSSSRLTHWVQLEKLEDRCLLTAGALDTTFGTGGLVVNDLGSTSDRAFEVVIQSDGKIITAGDTIRSGTGQDFALVRYNSNGALDTSFGANGRVTTDFGGVDMADSLAIQADGKIVVAGSKELAGTSVFALARYNPNGSLDSSFGSQGKVTTAIGIDDGARDVAIQSDGLIVAAGFYSVAVGNGVRAEIALTRYLDTGALDPAFGLRGVVTLPVTGGLGVGDWWDPSVAIQANGKIVVAGTKAPADYPNTDFLLTRVNGDGSLDTTFGTGGVVTTDVGPTFSVTNSDDVPNAVAIQADGKIVAAGRHFNPSTSGHDISLARYLGDPPLLAATAPSHSRAEIITTSDAQPLLSEAFTLWQSAGVDTTGLSNVQVQIANLGGTTLGLASGNTIWLDDHAAGWGWFIDSTPADRGEFFRPGNQGEQNRMDLLTVVMHELGHLLGQDHHADGVMAATLVAGVRNISPVDEHAPAVDAVFSQVNEPYANDFLSAIPDEHWLSHRPRLQRRR